MRLAAALFAAVVLLAGCTGSDTSSDGSPAPTASSTDSQAAAAAKAKADKLEKLREELEAKTKGVDVRIVIKDGKVTPQGARINVGVGERVTLQITSDTDEEVHVHSDPEHTYRVSPGDSQESFTVDTPGQVAVEAHELGVTIVQLVVRP